MKSKNSTLHLICGLPGTGKTTLAKRLESESDFNAIRLSPDEWIKDIWPIDTAEIQGNKFRDHIEQLQWKIGKKILQSGTDIIIEWGTWGKDERIKLRDEAWEVGSRVKFYYLEETRDIIKNRIIKRNKNLGNYEFHMPDDTLDEVLDKCFNSLQIPDEDELKSYDSLG